MADDETSAEVAYALKQWKGRRGSLIMMLHEIQNARGFVPRAQALELARAVDVPLARIYEVLTFYNYFKLASPGRAVVSVCTGTACHLKGANDLVQAFGETLGIESGQTTADGDFHLQTVRCVGCCGLAPVVVINGRTYGKCRPSAVGGIVEQWRNELGPASLEVSHAE